MKNKITIFLFIVSALWVQLAMADVAPEPITGGVTIYPQNDKETQIRLLNEKVNVDVWKDIVRVRAIFTLQNTGEGKRLIVGFPYSYGGELKDFRVKINEQEPSINEDQVTKEDEHFKDKKYTTYWKTWGMDFLKDESKDVEVYYSTIPRKLYPYHEMTWDEVSPWYTGTEKAEIENKLIRFGVGYILTTGAAWKGEIKQALVKFTLHDVDTGQIEEFGPRSGQIKDNGIEWNFENFEPQENIGVTIFSNIQKDALINLYEETFRKHSDDAILAESLGNLYIKKGEIDKALNVYKRFLLPVDQVPKLWAEGSTNPGSAIAACIWRMSDFIIDNAERLELGERKICAQKSLPIHKKFLDELNHNGRTWGGKEGTRDRLEKYIQTCNELLRN